MDFIDYDLHQLRGDETVEVTLGTAAFVRLLDAANFDSYRHGRQYTFFGGYVTQSPVRLPVPNAGHWHLVLDLNGHVGQIRSAVRVLPVSPD